MTFPVALVFADVQAPAWSTPTDEQSYHDETHEKPDIHFLKQNFYREAALPRSRLFHH